MIIDLSHLCFIDKEKYHQKIQNYLEKYAKFLYPDYGDLDSDALETIGGPTVFHTLDAISNALYRKYNKRGFLSAYKDFHQMYQGLIDSYEINDLLSFLSELDELYENELIEEDIKTITGTTTPPMVAILLSILHKNSYLTIRRRGKAHQIIVEFVYKFDDIITITNDTNTIIEQSDLRSRIVYAHTEAIVRAIKIAAPEASKEELRKHYERITEKNIIPYHNYEELLYKLMTNEFDISTEQYHKFIKQKRKTNSWFYTPGTYRSPQEYTSQILEDQDNAQNATGPTWTTFEGEVEVDLIREGM